MTVFADASSLVKLSVDEPGADVVRGIAAPAVAEVSRVEVAAALWGKARAGTGTTEEIEMLVSEFAADRWGEPGGVRRFSVLATSPAVLEVAVELTGRHLLRGHDAVQLASAATAASADPTIALLAHDHRLLGAARAEGLALDPGCPIET